MINKPKLFNALLMGSVCLNVAFNAAAQVEERVSTSAKALEEVFVSARRQDENAQTVPVAMTAVTQQSMEEQLILTVNDIQRSAPNLSITTGSPGGAGFAFLAMRGLSNLQAGVENDPAVGTYVDGVFLSSPAVGLLDFNDVQQVEVLRGPQGTLFGRATIGGALNIITNQPTGEFEGWIKGEVGNYSMRNVSGVVNIPIKGDELALRFSAHHKEHDGYGEAVVLDQDLADQHPDDFIRGKLLYAPSDAWDFTLSVAYNKMLDDGQLAGLNGWTDPYGIFAGFGISLDPYLQTKGNWDKNYGTNPGQDTHDELRTTTATAIVNGDLDWAQFKSITGWQKFKTDGSNDLDATPIEVLTSHSTYKAKTFTQELQLSGEMDDFNWITGLYFLQLRGTEQSEFRTFGLLAPTVPGGFIPFAQNFGSAVSKSYAVFAQGYYNITDELRATAGLRWTRDDRDVVISNTSVWGNPATCTPDALETDGSCGKHRSVTQEYPAFTLGLDYQAAENIFLYAKTSEASMAGGWNLRQGSVPAFDPEKVNDIEIGVKSDWLDRTLRLNLAYFHSWRTDLQANASALVNGASTQFVRNAGDAQIDGIEFEASILPWEGMQITASLGWLSASYDSGTFTEVQNVGGINYVVDRSGEEPVQTPEWTYNISATQSIPVAIGTVAVSLSYAYIDEQTMYEGTPADAQPDAVKAMYAIGNELGKQPSYGLLNGQVSLTTLDEAIEVSLWGANLTDKKYLARSFADLYTAVGTSIAYPGDPRTFGVGVRYRFQ